MSRQTLRPRRLGRPREGLKTPYRGLSPGARRVALLLTLAGMRARCEPAEDTIAAIEASRWGGRPLAGAALARRETKA